MHLYPFTQAASARPIPVLPLVPSIIVPPGFIFPSFSATSSIFKAMRSLIELPGLKYSTLAKTVQGSCFVILLSFIKGVLPIVSRILLSHIFFKFLVCKGSHYGVGVFAGIPHVQSFQVNLYFVLRCKQSYLLSISTAFLMVASSAFTISK